MTYQWKTPFHKVDADIAGRVCERLEEEGNLNAKTLVEVSRPEDAPLHPEFEWDDAAAAERWREQQARCIINHLTVVIDEKEPVRKFFNITASEANYTSIDVILQSTDSKDKLLQMALRELEAFKRKYSQLEELSRVFNAIDTLEEVRRAS